jgi:hypothetical protein
MTNPDLVSPERPHWQPEDLNFATDQLAREFPIVAKDRVTAAVNSAAPFVAPAEGRVQLMRWAREFLRLQV